MSEEEVVQEEAPSLLDFLAKYEGAPTAGKIEEWKQSFGEIYCSGFSDNELFIFRPLSWKEHKDFQKLAAQAEEQVTEADLQEKVVKTCLLWTSVKNLLSKGGNIPTLFEQIMMHSNFVPPQAAVSLVVRL